MLINIFYNYSLRFFVFLFICVGLCEFISTFSYFLCIGFLITAIIDIIRTTNFRIQSYILWCILISIAEILSRISGAQVAYEFGKYAIILLSVLLFVLNSIKPSNFILFLLLVLLIPGIFIGKSVEEITVYKNFAFYMSGQFCFIFALVCLYKVKISVEFYYLILKLIFVCCFLLSFFLFLKSPDLSEISFTTEANFQASGGFGPNQVSTVLGFGLFSGIILLLNGKTFFKNKIFDVFLILFLCFRILLTFSRGGATAAVISLLIYLLLYFIFLYKYQPQQSRKIFVNIFIVLFVLTVIWNIVDNLTEGILSKRYIETVIDDEDQNFSIKDSRVSIAELEIESFVNNVYFGQGVGGSQRYRNEVHGLRALSHNELTRLLGDHGLLGLIFIIILFVLIFLIFLNSGKRLSINNIALFSLAILTYLHSSTRLSFTCFLLALSYVLIIHNPKTK
ncbi:MAG TPA: hypothetical protein DIS94_09275 [Bacteroidetes bacterium]|nr:hypothetical protein [Bacteroidota bacterium]